MVTLDPRLSVCIFPYACDSYTLQNKQNIFEVERLCQEHWDPGWGLPAFRLAWIFVFVQLVRSLASSCSDTLASCPLSNNPFRSLPFRGTTHKAKKKKKGLVRQVKNCLLTVLLTAAAAGSIWQRTYGI